MQLTSCRGRRIRLVLLFALLLAAAVQAAEWRHPAPQRIVAFADVHGAYEELVGLLQELGLVDETLRWRGGSTHLVSLGDLLDRGARSRDVLDLLIRLQREAEEAGGAVRVVLGNHEMMNLTGDLGYVSQAEYAAFAAEETAEMREAAWQRFAARSPGSDRAAFDRRYPAGFFAHRTAFAPTGRYGRWLIERPVLAQVGDTVFVHGGLPALVAELGGEALNQQLGADIRAYAELFYSLVDEGVLAPDAPFAQRVELARSAGLDGERLARLERLSDSPAFDTRGPLWYRGSSLCYPASEIPIAAAALQRLDAKRAVVGHTITAERRVTSRFDGRVIRLDTGMLTSAYHGHPSALLIEADRLAVRYTGETAAAAPIPEPRRVGERPGGLDDDALEAFLRTAAVVQIEDVPTGVTQPRRVTLSADGIELAAVFKTVETDVGGGRASRSRNRRLTDVSDRWQYEVAAYRLDRLLDLRMVPVTVEREINGSSGSLQFWLEGTTSLKARIEQNITDQGWCPLDEQYNLMFVFDTLIYNSDRTQENVLYTVADWMVRLIDHSRAFRTSGGRPADVEDKTLDVNPEIARRLASLDESTLRETLEPYLDRRQIRAVLKRRDELLELAR